MSGRVPSVGIEQSIVAFAFSFPLLSTFFFLLSGFWVDFAIYFFPRRVRISG